MLSVNLGMVKPWTVLMELLIHLVTRIHCEKALKQLRYKKYRFCLHMVYA